MSPTSLTRSSTPSTARERFAQPSEVVESTSLAPSEKRHILLEWLADECALVVAADEGMLGGRPPEVDSVQRALRTLAN